MGGILFMRRKAKKLLSFFMAVLICAGIFVVPASAAEPADHVVISQVYGGGGNSGATYKNDFIELYNPTDSDVDLTGWSVQYASSTGTSWTATTLSGTISANSYYLVQEKAGNGGTTELPTPDATDTISMSGTGGKIALVSSTTALSGTITGGTGTGVVDFVGYGGATTYEGNGPAPAPSNTTSAIRTDSAVDTDDNSADFSTGEPTPRNSSYSASQCEAPTADVEAGAVAPGVEVTFSSGTSDATIEYNTDSSNYSGTWTSASTVTVNADTTYYVRAVKVGLTDSEVSTFVYTVLSQCDTPTASLSSGSTLVSGVTVTFSCATSGATIEYNTDSSDYSGTWTTGNTVTVTADTTYYVRAVLSGITNSNVATFSYTSDTNTLYTISEAKALPSGTANVKVSGIVSYISGKNVYIQDTTGAICLYLSANNSSLSVGDEVTAIGTRADYGNLLEISGVNESYVAVLSKDNTVPDLGTATVAELIAQPVGLTAGYNHMCEIIDIEGATLTSTSLLSKDGSDITIYPTVTLSNFSGVEVGDTVNVTVRMYNYYSSGSGTNTLEIAIIDMTNAVPVTTLEVSASPDSSSVVSGTTVALSCNDGEATIYYTTDGNDPTASSSEYSTAIEVTGDIGDTFTIKALAVKAGMDDSVIATFTYTILDPDAAMTIKDVLQLSSGTSDVKVTGQIVYFATSYSNPVLQASIDGETYSLYIFGAAPDGAGIGDFVTFTGTYSLYNGLPELSSITAFEITDSDDTMDPEIYTVAKILSDGASMLGRYVKIENVTLGTYSSTGSTPVTDGTGTINIYKAVPFQTGVEAGDVVDLYAMVSCYNSTIQLYTGTAEANGYNVYSVVNDTKAPVVTLPDAFLDAKTGQDYTISVDAADNKGIASVTITYTIGTITVTDQAMTLNAETGKYEYTISGSEILGDSESIVFTVTATDVTGLTSTSSETTVTVNNLPQITDVTPGRNSATGNDKTPLISVTLDNAGESPTVTVTVVKNSVAIVSDQAMTKSSENVYAYTPATLEDGKYTATVTVVRSDSKSNTESWSFTVGEAQYIAYFGQLHAHTAEYSDGSGTLSDSLNYLSSISADDNVDFISITDHSNYFDTTSAANPAAALNDSTQMTSASLSLWNAYVSAMEAFNTANSSLLALPGFEMTWSGGPGHINTFNSDGIISRNNSSLNNKSSDAGMKLYYDTLIGGTDTLSNLSQFNHPGTTFGNFSDFAYWTAAYDAKMVAVEVGNGEGAIDSGGYFPSYEQYTMALDKGWHVAPTNNQDNHKGHWGNSNTCRTVIYAEDFSEQGLLQGMYDMSVYATEDKNLNISYTVNDLTMGSIISDVPTEPLKFVINILDPDSTEIISKVEIVTNSGQVAASKSFTTNNADWEFELPAADGYYYVRVTEGDKNIAVTAPVWVGQQPLAGISSFACATELPVTGEELTLTATLFNSESGSATLKSIEYKTDENETLLSETPGTAISSGGTLQHSCSFTPTQAGAVTVTVTAVLTIDGVDRTYTMDADLLVLDSDKLVYVGVDASHYNEYVDGNYKDSMGNFTSLAVDYGVRVVILETSADLIAATQNAKYKMLVLTTPTRRDGSAILSGYKNYSDTEIAAVKAFSESGGTLIITGWGDYYESYSDFPSDDHMAAQQNKLLAAVGSTLRISDDEIKDDVTNGGQSQRLYLTNYNLDNPFLDRVVASEQVYSNYGGSTIYAVDDGGNPATAMPSSVSPMVYAFDTSYSSDDDSDSFAGVAIPKYGGKYMVAASETVSHTSGADATVIVAGSCFLSNFEIQATMDSYSTPEYSNYTILQNVISSINPVTITDIADVQAVAEGETFTIVGITTSNASGYDTDTAFFDCIYVQDDTAGINAFPVSGNIQAGQTVRITGTTSSYNGERQISVTKIEVIDSTINSLPDPISETTAQAASGQNLGSLVKVSGTVQSITNSNGLPESILVKDSSGTTCRIFIDGYITDSKTIANLAVGCTLTAVGLSSIDTVGTRIRIRDRADIVCRAAGNGNNVGGGATGGDTTPTDDDAHSTTNGNTTTSSTTVSATTDPSTGKVNVSVPGETFNTLTKEAKAAEASGQKSVIEIRVDETVSGSTFNVEIPKISFNEIATGTDAKLTVETGIGSVSFDSNAVEGINSAANTDISVSIAKVDTTSLPASVQETVGDRPVYDFTVSSGDETISTFGNGKAEISIPYTPADGENTNNIVVYYISDSGELETVRGKYNAETGMVEFTTTHFSQYAIGYNIVNFDDVNSTDWYYDAVEFIAARGITSGTGDNCFSPDGTLTRGQFIVMLMRAYGIAPDENPTDNFSDAGNTYYTGYLAAANRLGISNGTGNNNFAPDSCISRQDMFTLLYRALDVLGELPESSTGRTVNGYSDADEISDYALEAMDALVDAGIISGSNNGLNPTGTSTRAQMAQVLYNLLSI